MPKILKQRFIRISSQTRTQPPPRPLNCSAPRHNSTKGMRSKKRATSLTPCGRSTVRGSAYKVCLCRLKSATLWSSCVRRQNFQRDRPPSRADKPGLWSIPTHQATFLHGRNFDSRLLAWTVRGVACSSQQYTH